MCRISQLEFLRKNLILLAMIVACNTVVAQKKQYDIACVGFYNLENLFDTENDTLINDEAFLPSGRNAWTPKRYQEKLGNMAKVISLLGREKTKEGVALLGVAEIENRKVLEDLIAHPKLKAKKFGIAHYDSRDFRGIDVALLYQKELFKVDTSRYIRLELYQPDSTKLRTRDILHVTGKLKGDKIHVLVNHWPSRRGGESRSAKYRNAAARACQNVVDALTKNDPQAKVIIMGDLNDDPVSESVSQILLTKTKKKDVIKSNHLYNTMYDSYKKGLGSNAYRDAWSLFDQIIISKALLDKNQKGYFHFQTQIYNPKFLVQESGRYKGYPNRTFAGGQYLGGYSDHFPVFLYLIKEVSSS